jgi:hypothetical protein
MQVELRNSFGVKRSRFREPSPWYYGEGQRHYCTGRKHMSPARSVDGRSFWFGLGLLQATLAARSARPSSPA